MPGAFGMMDQLPTTINQRDVCTIGTSSKGKRPLRALSASDKIDAIQRVNDGESKASVARDIGVPESTLRGWCKNEDKLRYMSSRHSTPDTDKSSDGLTDSGLPEKRAKYDLSAAALNYSQNGMAGQYGDLGTDLSVHGADRAGLDLSRVKKEDSDMKASDMMHSDFSSYTRSSLDLAKSKSDLNKYATDLSDSMLHKDGKHKLDSGATMSMSAISPLSGLNHLSGLSGLGQSHLGVSFNEIATNLSLIAQLNPSLSALTNSINSSAKALRSIRSPKPSHNSSGIMPEKHKSSKSHHHSDPYHEKSRTSRSSHSTYKDSPVDETLWYWLKKQQAMLSMTGAASAHNPLSMSQHNMPSSRSSKDSHGAHSAKAASSLPPIAPPMDALNKNSWFWQYYKQFTGSLGLPDDKAKIPPLVKQEAYENILYSHLTKEKTEMTPCKEEIVEQNIQPESSEDKVEEPPVKECYTPPPKEKIDKDGSKNSTRARAVLDNLLFNNNNNVAIKETPDLENGEKDSNAENVFGCEVNEALEHGEKFLKWLEACQEPSVTRMQVHQLKGMLNNIKANAERRIQNSNIKDRVSRRK